MLGLFLLATLIRTYHPIPLADLATTRWTHVTVRATVRLVKKEADGDWHIGLQDGKASGVAEIIPLLPLTPPKVGQCIVAKGIARVDGVHKWGEIHPLESWEVCR